MPINARTKGYQTANDTDWLEIGSVSDTRRVLFIQVSANSSPLYMYIGQGTPNIADSILMSALDVLDLERADIMGPIRIKASTGGIARVVVLG